MDPVWFNLSIKLEMPVNLLWIYWSLPKLRSSRQSSDCDTPSKLLQLKLFSTNVGWIYPPWNQQLAPESENGWLEGFPFGMAASAILVSGSFWSMWASMSHAIKENHHERYKDHHFSPHYSPNHFSTHPFIEFHELPQVAGYCGQSQRIEWSGDLRVWWFEWFTTWMLKHWTNVETLSKMTYRT